MPISIDKTTSVPAPTGNAAFPDPEPATQQELAFFGFLTAEQRRCLPDWLVIAPPKTGTSWLYTNLREHPEIYVPPTKELKYFSHLFESEDLRSYLDHFRDGLGKVKGEVSPSYSMLPRSTIRLIRKLMPDLKLIFLMRDPVERAWSHARHSFCQGEANFKGRRGTIDDVTDEEWIANVDDDWNRLSGDYLGQLRRWLSVFPRERVYVGFFENLVNSPRTLLREVLEFLGLDPDFANSTSITVDAINIGHPKQASPRLLRHLRELYAERTAALAAYLDREFHLPVPAAWVQSFGTAIGSAVAAGGESGIPAVRRTWGFDDDALARLLARDDLFEMDFLGFKIIRHGASYRAYRSTLEVERPEDFDSSWWQEHSAEGDYLVADNPYDLKSMILRQTVCREAPSGSQSARLRQVALELDRLFRGQAEMEARFTELTGVVTRETEVLDCLVRRLVETDARLAKLKQDLRAEPEVVNGKHMLPSVERCAISPDDCLKPSQELPVERAQSCGGVFDEPAG